MGSESKSTGPKHRIIALALGKSGVVESLDGGAPNKFPVRGEVSAESLAKALDTFTGTNTQVLIIGTRRDGTPGWDAVDPKVLTDAIGCKVKFLSEAQALHRGLSPDGVAGYIILATALRDPADGIAATNVVGSARWWVQDGSNVERTNVHLGGDDYGQLYTIGGCGSLLSSPSVVASMAAELLRQHRTVRRLYIWSQDGITGPVYANDGPFWQYLQPLDEFSQGGGQIKVLRTASDMLTMVSRTSS